MAVRTAPRTGPLVCLTLQLRQCLCRENEKWGASDPMDEFQNIRERLIKLEALFARGATAGERAAAGAHF